MSSETDVGRYPLDGEYIVRMYDKHERRWFDISASGLTLQEAAELWDEKTNGATEHTRYEDGHYYEVFPADTTMLFSPEVMDD